MISVRVAYNDEKAIERLGKLARFLPGALRVGMQAFVGRVTADTVEKKLSGQVLRRITGTLQRAVIGAQLAQIKPPQKVIGRVGVSRLSYGVWHEQGYDGPETVYAHTVKAHEVAEHSRTSAAGKRFVVTAHRRRAHVVKEYTRQRHIPARHFLSSTLKEDAPLATDIFQKSVAILSRTQRVPNLAELLREIR